MSHFAQLDEDNMVLQILVVANEVLLDEDGNEVEQKGIDFCKSLIGEDTNWIQASYNGTIRKIYPAVGDSYDEAQDAFIPRKPFDSWVWDSTEWTWTPPVPMPTTEPNGNAVWRWSEINQEWREFDPNAWEA